MTKLQRYAITFGEVAILHIGSAQVGTAPRPRGLSVCDLRAAASRIKHLGGNTELVILSDALPEDLRAGNEAATLVVRGGASLLLGRADAADALLREQDEVKYDAKYWDRRYGRTLHKRARHNVVFGEEGQGPSEDFRAFTIKAFSELPLLAAVRAALPNWLGEAASCLNAEGSLYFDSSSGIGFHGDSERKIVVCLSLGASSTLRYHWRLPASSEHMFEAVDIRVHHGDIYIMSEKATGFDWRRRSHVRVVHAAGSDKYIGPAATLGVKRRAQEV